MTRHWTIVLMVLLIAIVAWGLMVETGTVSVTFNGEQLTGPFKGVIATGGFIVSTVALFCLAIVLAFVFSGLGLMLLGFFLFGGLILAGVMLPFLFPLLVPLVIVWIFIALTKWVRQDGADSNRPL